LGVTDHMSLFFKFFNLYVKMIKEQFIIVAIVIIYPYANLESSIVLNNVLQVIQVTTSIISIQKLTNI